MAWQMYLLEREDAHGFAVVAESEQHARSIVANRWPHVGMTTAPEPICIELGTAPPERSFPQVLLRDSAAARDSRS